MSGGKKKSTVGWRYFFALFMGLGRGPLDAIRMIRVGDRTAWAGNVTSNTTVYIDAPNLFGGEEKEGGIQGPLQILMGESTQTPTAELLAAFGSPLPGFRGVVTTFFDGLLSMNNPYPKQWKYRVNRILKGWDGDVFQPNLARIPLDNNGDVVVDTPGAFVAGVSGLGWNTMLPYPVNVELFPSGGAEFTTNEKGIRISNIPDGTSPGLTEFVGFTAIDVSTGEAVNTSSFPRVSMILELTEFNQTPAYLPNDVFHMSMIFLLRSGIPAFPTEMPYRADVYFGYYGGVFQFWLQVSRDHFIEILGTVALGPRAGLTMKTVVDVPQRRFIVYIDNVEVFSYTVDQLLDVRSAFTAAEMSFNSPNNLAEFRVRNFSLLTSASASAIGANGAHIIYETLTNRKWGRGLLPTKIDADSFTLAATDLVNENFPMCIKWLRQDELKSFVQNVQNHIGSVIYTHRQTGLICLKLIRGNYEFDDLPVYDMSNGLLEIREATVGVVSRGVNTINVAWHDPIEDQPRSVTVKNGAAIQLAGGVINAATKKYDGCPTENLALRLGQRDLRASSTLVRKFVLVANRNLSHLHPGDVFAIQDVERAIPKMAVRVGKVKDGTLRDGKLVIDVIQDVFSLPTKSFSSGAPSTYEPPDTKPCIDQQRVFEAPYFMLAGRMAPADLDYVNDNGGYMAVLNSKGKNTNVSIQIAVRDGLSEPEDLPPDDSYVCSMD